MSSETPNEGGPKKPPIPTPAKKIPAFNIEKRGDRLYPGDSLNKWFAIASLLLFVITIAMMLADYSREWKKYQRDFVRLHRQFPDHAGIVVVSPDSDTQDAAARIDAAVQQPRGVGPDAHGG